eukprot:1989009-Pleurochrysis_carterae.AAC.3
MCDGGGGKRGCAVALLRCCGVTGLSVRRYDNWFSTLSEKARWRRMLKKVTGDCASSRVRALPLRKKVQKEAAKSTRDKCFDFSLLA